MNAPDLRLGEIEASKVTTELEGIRARATAYRIWGTPGRHAPQDRDYLLAELRKRDDALARVEALADKWAALGAEDDWAEGGMADTVLSDAGRAIRAAVTAAKGDGDRRTCDCVNAPEGAPDCRYCDYKKGDGE